MQSDGKTSGVGPYQKSRCLVLTIRSAAPGDENVSNTDPSSIVEWIAGLAKRKMEAQKNCASKNCVIGYAPM